MGGAGDRLVGQGREAQGLRVRNAVVPAGPADAGLRLLGMRWWFRESGESEYECARNDGK